MKSLIGRLIREDAGQDLIEYALLAAFIALICIVAITLAGDQINKVFGKINDKLATVP